MIVSTLKSSIRNHLSEARFKFLRGYYWAFRNVFLTVYRKIIQAFYSKDKFYINIGGGLHFKFGWRTLDYHSSAYPYNSGMLDYNFNLQLTHRDKNPIPIKSNSTDLIFSSHTMEHITIDAVTECFYEFHRMLKEGGIFRLIVPDVNLALKAYRNKDSNFFKLCNYNYTELETGLLEYFSCNPKNSIDVSPKAIKIDMETLQPNEFLQKYQTTEIAPNHDYSQHVTWLNFERIKKLGIEAGFSGGNIHLSHYKKKDTMDPKNKHLSVFVEMVNP